MNMLFGKKENKAELPDLPPLPPLPLKDSGQDNVGMPEFPDLPEKRESYGGAGIQPPGRKDAFLDEPRSAEEKKVSVVEMEEWHPQKESNEEGYEMGLPEVPHMPEMPEEERIPKPRELEHLPVQRRMYVQNKQSRMAMQPQQTADVFVRIDKFHTARKSLSEIQNRLNDIDELIRRVRETKLKEEQELASWEKDLMQIKARVQTVTENIFEKVE